jgi:hypothetical protein
VQTKVQHKPRAIDGLFTCYPRKLTALHYLSYIRAIFLEPRANGISRLSEPAPSSVEQAVMAQPAQAATTAAMARLLAGERRPYE